MGVELVVFYGFQFRRSPFWIVVAAIIAANVVSTLVGFIVLGLLSSLVLGVFPSLEHGPDWLVYLGFLVAWALTVGVEYWVYRWVQRWRQFSHLLIAVAVSNVASYSVLGVALWYQTKL